MLIGEPATRKSTSIKISKRLLLSSGYESFAADKTRLEKFLMDLEGIEEEQDGPAGKRTDDYAKSTTARSLFGDLAGVQEPREVYIAADEFNEFTSLGNSDFYTTLGNLWDWDSEDKPYTHRLKNSRSVSIYQPTVSILGGNTPENFAKAFPPEIIGNGFLSRLLLIYGERSARKYAFPPVPGIAATQNIVRQLQEVRKLHRVEVPLTPDAKQICFSIYNNWPEPEDVRFQSYYQRRYTQLLKLSLLISASKLETVISASCILESNTILAAAEVNMGAALGEFGKSKNSDVVNRILGMLEVAVKPMNMNEIWKEVMRDLTKIDELVTILHGLVSAGKIQWVRPIGYLLQKAVGRKYEYVDFNKFLTEEEREML